MNTDSEPERPTRIQKTKAESCKVEDEAEEDYEAEAEAETEAEGRETTDPALRDG
jgi:hypothetical protein